MELVHAYSLTHDDLPCMDDDDERRGRPACHRVYGEATALLAGNGLLLRAMEEMLDGSWPAERACEATLRLVRSCGSRGLLAGQQRDLDAADDENTIMVTSRDQDRPSDPHRGDAAHAARQRTTWSWTRSWKRLSPGSPRKSASGSRSGTISTIWSRTAVASGSPI